MSTALLLGVFASRVLLFPDGPWEQDEALFASGVQDFDMARHRPHPPGFPAWIAMGKVLAWFTSDALGALRLASSLASTLAVWLLARLVAPRAGAAVAVCAALAWAMSPLVWAHGHRAFSTTPALALLLLALWWWETTEDRDARTSAGWVALGLALAVRPQVLPEALMVGLVGLYRGRLDPRGLARDVAIGVATTLVLFVPAIVDTGGLARFWAVTGAHLSDHGSTAVGRTLPVAQWGFVRALGGPWSAGSWAVVTALGLGVSVRRDRASGAWLTLLVFVTGWAVFRLHHPGFPRYSVIFAAVCVPPIAIVAGAVGPRVGAIILALSALLGAFSAERALVAMHRRPLPVVAALRSLNDGSERPVLFSHGSFSFVRWARDSGVLDRPIVDVGSADAIPRVTAPYDALGGGALRFLPGATVCVRSFADFPAAVRPLAQGRFEQAIVARNPVVLGAGVHRPERDGSGAPFAWLSERGVLHVPGGATALALQFHVGKDRAPQRLRASMLADEGQTEIVTLLESTLAPGDALVRIPLASCADGCAVTLELPDAIRGTADARMMSARLVAAWAEGEGLPVAGTRWSPGTPAAARAAGATLEGVYGAERFGKGKRPGAWVRPEARVQFPASPGVVRVTLARPEHLSPWVTLRTAGHRAHVEVPKEPTTFELEVSAPGGLDFIAIEAAGFVPKERNPASTDGRELSLILYDVELDPDVDACPTARVPGG